MGSTRGGAARAGVGLSPGQLQAMVDAAGDAMLAIDVRGRVLFANPAVERMFGYSNAELVGHNVRLLTPEPDRSAHDGYLRNYLDTRIAKVLGTRRDVTARRKNGSEFPVNLMISEYAVTEAGATRFIGILRDVTDRVAAERKQRRFFEMSGDLLCVAGVDGYFKKLNPAWSRTLGYTAEELLAQPYLNLVHPDDREATETEAAALLDTEYRAVSFENRYRCKDGTYKWLQWHAVPDPGTGLIFAAARDITDKKEEIEQRLRDVQRLEAVGQLAGGVANDFNNLMTVVLGNLELLKEHSGGDATARGWAQSGIRAVDRGRSLTNRLLAFSRRQMLRPRSVDLNEHSGGVVEMLERTLGEHVQIRLSLAEGLWPRVVDPDELDHALANLAINARDAMPEGGALTLETSNRSLDASYAPSGGRAGRLRVDRRDRHRHQHPRRDPIENLRSVLHHQASGLGLGPGSEHVRIHQADRRTPFGLQRAWRRHDVPPALPAVRRSGGPAVPRRRRRRWPAAKTARPAKSASWWSRTTRTCALPRQ